MGKMTNSLGNLHCTDSTIALIQRMDKSETIIWLLCHLMKKFRESMEIQNTHQVVNSEFHTESLKCELQTQDTVNFEIHTESL